MYDYAHSENISRLDLGCGEYSGLSVAICPRAMDYFYAIARYRHMDFE
jgi:hypothetical protein